MSAARILFGMGRDNVLPRKLFAYLHGTRNAPVINIAIVGVLGFAVALVVDYERSAELLNSGALLAFMGVNVATFWQFYIRGHAGRTKRILGDAGVPLVGFFSGLGIWLSLPSKAMRWSGEPGSSRVW